MFEKLKDVVRKILKANVVDKDLLNSVLKDIRLSLLEADVSTNLVDSLINEIRKKVEKEKTPAGLTLREHLIKTIYDEMVKLLGEKFYPLEGKKIMLVGLFGSGKTTTTGKLAYYFKKQGKKVAVVGLDYHRPAAPEQLKQLAESIGVKYLIGKDPFTVAREALSKFSSYDVILFDTAGRNALDKELAEELNKLGKMIQPDEVLLVLPADIGKVAGKQAEEFNKLVKITGLVITKTDSTAKAGGALSACSVTGAKIKFIGVGEKVKDLEKYDPKRFVSRMLDLGDLQTLLEKSKEVFEPKKAEKIVEGKFTLNDFIDQIESMGSIGPLQQIVSMIPGLGGRIPKDLLKKQEEKMKKWKYMIQSMTPEERNNPEIINESRIKRIAKGSGTREEEVRQLLEEYRRVKKMMKSLGGVKGLKRGQLQQLMRQFGLG